VIGNEWAHDDNIVGLLFYALAAIGRAGVGAIAIESIATEDRWRVRGERTAGVRNPMSAHVPSILDQVP
jgi:hypothetical protein